MEDTIVSMIGSLGFPIAVAWFLLTKVSKVLDSATAALIDMKNSVVGVGVEIAKIGQRIDVLEREREASKHE